jgi:hypothetical protein
MKNYFINGRSIVQVVAGALFAVQFADWYPYKTGNLRDRSTYLSEDGMSIIFDATEVKGDEAATKAPYIPALEYGYSTQKHKGFIAVKSLKAAKEFIIKELDGTEVFYRND